MIASTCRTCGTPLLPGALLCGECGTSAIAPRPTLGDTARYDRAAFRAALAAAAPPAAAPPTAARSAAPERRPEAVPRRAHPAHAAPSTTAQHRFGLVFSTGESIRVAGTGLVGRNPEPRLDEHIDYLVQIVDPARSVSKTHLEFAVDGHSFWVRDRDSTNGTRVGDDPLDSVELPPGEWTRLVPGDRVLLGDQWFDLH